MKEPACVGGQEKERRAADGGIFISTLLEFVLYKQWRYFTCSPAWRPHKRVATVCEYAPISCHFSIYVVLIKNSRCCKPQRKQDMEPFIHQRQFKVFINDPPHLADRRAARSPNFLCTSAENPAYCCCSIQMCNTLATKSDTITSCKDGANIQYVSSHSASCS